MDVRPFFQSFKLKTHEMKLSFLKQTNKQTKNTIYNYNNIKQIINIYSNWTKYTIKTLIDIFVA